ncbi:MAG: tetratricopeptide repeat protein [Desulfopila sp.]|nr:tetratricopeptide repeat protein [Desulfopila sp.]
MKKQCANVFTGFLPWPLGALLLLLVTLLFSCSEMPSEGSGVDEEPHLIEIDGLQLPVFGTAEEQLNYTRSWFAETDAKKAALQALLHLYPESRRYCALAELDLAYLELGDDYRFAPRRTAFAAIKAYRNVVQRYPDFPDISAKAYWYIAWIYSDLLNDRHRGIKYYQRVADTFPDEEVTLLPSAPWFSIIYPDRERSTLLSPQENYWAALALVEIIRYTENDETAWNSFQQLWQNYRKTVSTGVGLRLILERQGAVGEVREMAHEFLQNDFSNVHLLGDIQLLLHVSKRVEEQH